MLKEIQSKIEADDQNKIVDQKCCSRHVFVSKQSDISANDYAHIMPIYDKPLLSGQPPSNYIIITHYFTQ